MRKLTALTLGIVLSLGQLLAQTKTITGIVKDEKGNGVPFASIKNKRSNVGVSADENGKFSIQVPQGDVLVISSTGFDNIQLKITSETEYQITLKHTAQLNDVVVTALNIKRSKSTLPYSAQQVNGEDISKVRSSNFVSTLSGKVSGLEIRQSNTLGGSTNIVLRGFKSLTGNNQVLFVVDGVPIDNSNNNTSDQRRGAAGYDYGNAAADINPDDIESVNVLKGAAATALYGSRAANGVVLIVTKKAKKGLGITINTGVTVGSIDPSTFPKYQKQYGAGYGSANGYGSPDGNFFYFDVNGDGIDDLVAPTTEDASWGAKFDPKLMVYQWDAFDPTSPYYHKARPWVAAANDPYTFFVNPVSINNSVAIDAGSDKGWFKLGYTKTDETGILPNSRIVKDLLNFGASYKVTDNLTATVNANFSKINGLGRYETGYAGTTTGGVSNSINVMNNFREWWQTNVDIQELKDAYLRTRQNIAWNLSDPSDPSIKGRTPIYWDNPYFSRYQNYESDSRNRYFGYASLDYKINDWISVLGRVSLDAYDEVEETRVAVGSTTNNGVSFYSRFNRNFSEYNYDLLANVNKKISEDFDLKATAGVNIRRTYIASIRAQTNGGLVSPGLYSLSNSVNPIIAPVETLSTLGVDGIFASATLGYREYLFLDLSGRRDRSSSLPTANNAYFYPSVSLGFLFSKLLQKDLPWLSYGKFRVNYAEVGNSAPAQSLLDYYTINTGFGGVALNSVSTTKNNATLLPEKTKSPEIGLEMAFLKSRVGFDITYYKQNTINQIIPTNVSPGAGVFFKYINAGEIQNQGVELSLYGTPVKTKNFSWTINVNWSRNRNKVLHLGGGVTNLQLALVPGGATINATEGEPYGTIKGTDYVYTNGQKTVQSSGSNAGFYAISTSVDNVIGNVNPDWLGGITNSFTYKNFSLGFLIDIRKGGNVFSTDMLYGLATGLYPETAGLNDLGNPVRNSIANGGGIINPGVKADGTPNTKRVDISTLFGAYGYYRKPVSAFVYDASYVKLRELSLTYSLPIKSTSLVKGIDISIIGRNLWIIHKNLPYSDPEELASAGNAQGFQVGAYPTVRSVGFNVKVKF